MKQKIFKSIIITSLIAFVFSLIPLFIVRFTDLEISEKYLLLTSSAVIFCIAAFILARIFSKKIMKPINELDLDRPKIDINYGEIDNLIHQISRQNKLIDRQMMDLRRRQVEFKTITENMSEGIIILDNKSEILSYNGSALALLGAENVKEGEHFVSLSRSRKFISVVNDALNGRHGEGMLNIGQKVYQIFANPVMVENRNNGVVILIMDITEKEKREEMRREFTSNVSHELKTPLTTISGISELFMSGMVANQDIPKFAKNIHDEAARLLTLINDIIKLSRLDEATDPVMPDYIDLCEIVKEVKQLLTIPADERNISLTVIADPVHIMGNRVILTEMIYNLTDNAIKYNKDGGSVTITVKETDGAATVTVADTGIGIPAEHHDRIFERFYRVDKSHSKEVGGTGLGLSIVRHGAEYHKASLSVDSKENVGTSITIKFPI